MRATRPQHPHNLIPQEQWQWSLGFLFCSSVFVSSWHIGIICQVPRNRFTWPGPPLPYLFHPIHFFPLPSFPSPHPLARLLSTCQCYTTD